MINHTSIPSSRIYATTNSFLQSNDFGLISVKGKKNKRTSINWLLENYFILANLKKKIRKYFIYLSYTHYLNFSYARPRCIILQSIIFSYWDCVSDEPHEVESNKALLLNEAKKRKIILLIT